MITPIDFHEIVSGRRQGTQAALLRALLRSLETPYAFATTVRNACYDGGILGIHSVDVPVVSVGNLTLGGTGKTPMVHWLSRWFQDRALRVALISRGYKADRGKLNDEAKELAEKIGDIPHLQNRHRVRAALEAATKHRAQVILLDDGFQHRRLHRDLDIVLVDALEPFGFDHIFPRGTLREPLENIRRTDVVGLSRADAVTPDRLTAIRNRVRSLAPQATWFETVHLPYQLVRREQSTLPPTWLRGKSVAAFCGLGNPAGFQHTLVSCACRIAAFRELGDHHAYSESELESLRKWVSMQRPVEAVICTCKDLVKIGESELAGVPLYALDVRLQFRTGQSDLESRLRTLVPRPHASAA